MKTLQNFFGRIFTPKGKHRFVQTSLTSKSKKDQSEVSLEKIQTACDRAVSESDSIRNFQLRIPGIRSLVQSLAALLKKEQDFIVQQAQNEFEKACSDLEKHKSEMPEKKARLEDSFRVNKRHLSQVRSEKLKRPRAQLKKKKDRANEIEHSIYQMAKHLPEGQHTEKTFRWQNFLIIVGIVLLSCGEFTAVLNSLKLLRSSTLVEIPLAVSIVLSLFVMAKGLVWIGKKSDIIKWRNFQPNVWDNVLFMFICLAGCYTVFLGAMRVDFIECVQDQSLSFMAKTLLYLLNPALFICAVVLVAMYSNRTGSAIKVYATLLKRQRAIQRKIARLENKIRRIKLRYLTIYHRDKQNLLSDLEAVEVDQVEQLEKEVLERTNVLNSIEAHTAQTMTSFYQGAKSKIELACADIEVKAGETTEWSEISFSENNSCYQHPFKQNSKQKSQKPQSMKAITQQLTGALNVMLIALGLLLGSCSTESLQETGEDHVVLHLIDQTSYVEGQQYKVTGADIWNIGEMNENSMNGIEYWVTSISDISLSESQSIDVDPANELLSNEFERKDELKSMRELLDSILQRAYAKKSKQYEHTDLFNPLREVFRKAYSYPKETPITILLQSDLLHNKANLSLYDADLDENEREVLLRNINSILPGKNAKDRSIHLIVLYKPNLGNDKHFQLAFAIIKDFLESNGVKVSLKANL